MTNRSRFVFITGTRADFGKLKPLIKAISRLPSIEVEIFATGMHLQEAFGRTYFEVEQLGLPVFPFVNFGQGDSMAQILAKTVAGFADYVSAFPADYVVVHGDRPEALAGAIVGSLTNTKVIHIEGGELSGTVDESLRHAVTKMSHIHLVSNALAEERVKSLGEDPETVFRIGSPEIDVMASDELPNLAEVQRKYSIPVGPHAIFALHPVTTQDPRILGGATRKILEAISKVPDLNLVIISPNNDHGWQDIKNVFAEFNANGRFRVIPSMRFEYYLTLLKFADFIIGNSSSGVREAPFFGTPSINVGSRQDRRSSALSIINIREDNLDELEDLIPRIRTQDRTFQKDFGEGNSASQFIKLVESGIFEKVSIQKSLYID